MWYDVGVVSVYASYRWGLDKMPRIPDRIANISAQRPDAAAGTIVRAEPVDHLRPYAFHGVDLTVRGSHGVGECPFCGKAKFYVAVDTGLWSCKVCGSG